LTFNQPVGIASSGDGTNRLFVIEQTGIIRVFQNSRTVSSSSVFLDITSRILYGGEQGLLGLAFHPNYAVNGYFYVDYVADNPRRTVIARYSVSANNPNQALINSEFILLQIDQPSRIIRWQLALEPTVTSTSAWATAALVVTRLETDRTASLLGKILE
jgi:hypothetical protein